MLDSIKTTILAGLGVATFAQETLRAAVDELVKKGELTREQGEKVVRLLAEKGKEGTREAAEKLSQEIHSLLRKSPFGSRAELIALEARVAALELRLDVQAPDSPSMAGD